MGFADFLAALLVQALAQYAMSQFSAEHPHGVCRVFWRIQELLSVTVRVHFYAIAVKPQRKSKTPVVRYLNNVLLGISATAPSRVLC